MSRVSTLPIDVEPRRCGKPRFEALDWRLSSVSLLRMQCPGPYEIICAVLGVGKEHGVIVEKRVRVLPRAPEA